MALNLIIIKCPKSVSFFSMHKIGVVLLNYQTYIATINITKELLKQSIAQYLSIVIVDNASPNDSFVYLKDMERAYPQVKVILNKNNLGYARGNNVGILYLEKVIQPDYIAILNNDIILSKNSFEQLMNRYEQLKEPAIIAPLMKDIEGKIILPSRLNNFLEDCISTFICLNKIYLGNKYRKIQDIGNGTMAVDIIPGSFMFASLNVLKRIDYFSPVTFLYGEEAFIARKVKDAGLYNYLILNEYYIHAHRSPTISTTYDTAGKYRLLFDSIIQYTKLYRRHSTLKCIILRCIRPFSLFEKHIYDIYRKKH